MLNDNTKAKLLAASGPPTDLAKFGESLGVVEVERKELKVDGMVLPKGAGYKIILHSKKAAVRSRFSWAHEIGHIIVQSGSLAKPQSRGAPLSHKHLEKRYATGLQPKFSCLKNNSESTWTTISWLSGRPKSSEHL